jgi:phasin family protein
LRRSKTKGSFIMFIKISEQFTTAIKPFNSLIEINTKSFAQLINLQKTVFTGISWELAAQTKMLSTQTDLTKVINDQKYYNGQIQKKVSTSAQKAYEVASQSSEEIVNLVQGSISKVGMFSK